MSSQNINNVATATLSHQAVNLSQMQAADSAFVNLTTAQTVAGVKTFSSSPIVPAATSTGQAVRYNELILKADDNAVVKLTGAQTVAGVKTFSSSPIVPAAASTGQAVRYDELILKADDSVVVKLSGAQTIAGVKTFTNNLSMNSTQRIVNVVDPVNAQDVATKNYADTLITGIPRYPPLRTTQSGTTFTARTILASNIDPYVGDDVVETLNEGYIYTSQIYCVKNVTYTGIVVSFGTAGVAPNTPPNCNFVWGIFSQDGATRYAATGVNTPLTSSGPQAYDFTGGTFTCPASGYYVAVTYFRNNGGLSGTKCDFKMAKFSGWWSGNVNTVNNWETVASEQNFGVSGTFPTALSGAYTTRTQSPIFMMY